MRSGCTPRGPPRMPLGPALGPSALATPIASVFLHCPTCRLPMSYSCNLPDRPRPLFPEYRTDRGLARRGCLKARATSARPERPERSGHDGLGRAVLQSPPGQHAFPVHVDEARSRIRVSELLGGRQPISE